MTTSSLGIFSHVGSVWDTCLTWQMPFFCCFAVWCYLPRFARRQCWNESSKSYGKLCWTPSREQLFCLRWATRVWVWSTICFSFFIFSSLCLPSTPSSCPPVSLSVFHFLHLFNSLLLPHNTQTTVQEMKQHGISKSSHTCFFHTVNPSVRAGLTFFISGISNLQFFVADSESM